MSESINTLNQIPAQSGVYSFRIDIDERVKELKTQSIEHILYEIYEKNSDGEWEKKQVLIQSRHNSQAFSDTTNQKKADQYKSWGKLAVTSASIFCSMGAAFCTVPNAPSLSSLLFGGIGRGFDAIDKTFVEDRRLLQITLLDNQYSRVGNIISERGSDIQKADYQKSLDAFNRILDQMQRSVREIFNA